MNEQQNDENKGGEESKKVVHIKHNSDHVNTKYGRWIPAANLSVEDTIKLRKLLGLPS